MGDPYNTNLAFLVVLVSFEGKLRDAAAVPSVWVIPARKLAPFIKKYRTRNVISRARVEASGTRFRAAWHLVAR